MSEIHLASIIISNYNYGHFLNEAIDSALNQIYQNTEVIVVDDGSTDKSREIIAGYGDRVLPVLKHNGGQASAFNAGFAVSRGRMILFLDSDDVLLPTAVEETIGLFHDPNVVKVHWPLWVVDAQGRKTGKIKPHGSLPEGNLREIAIRGGPTSHLNPPSSGNAWSRKFLEKIFPMPEVEFKICADTYLLELAPLFGEIRRILEPQSSYRLHGENNYMSKSFDEKLRHEVKVYDNICYAMSKYCSDMGINLDPEVCKRNSWVHRLQLAMQDIGVIPLVDTFILVDQDEWATDEILVGRRRIPFLERNGYYWGAPPDDDTAIRELERLRRSGAHFMVIAWPAFWWLEYYTGLHVYLRSNFTCILQNDRLVVFDLR